LCCETNFGFYAVAGVLSMSQQLNRSITTPRVTSTSMAMVFSINAKNTLLLEMFTEVCLQEMGRKGLWWGMNHRVEEV
jgi:hypothetical protein